MSHFKTKTKTLQGRAIIKLPKTMALAALKGDVVDFKVTVLGRAESEFMVNVQGADTFIVQLAKNGMPLLDNVEIEFEARLTKGPPGEKAILKRALDKPAVPVTVFNVQSTLGQTIIDFGWYPPGWSVDLLDEGSIEPHTRLSLNPELVRKLHAILGQTLATHDNMVRPFQ